MRNGSIRRKTRRWRGYTSGSRLMVFWWWVGVGSTILVSPCGVGTQWRKIMEGWFWLRALHGGHIVKAEGRHFGHCLVFRVEVWRLLFGMAACVTSVLHGLFFDEGVFVFLITRVALCQLWIQNRQISNCVDRTVGMNSSLIICGLRNRYGGEILILIWSEECRLSLLCSYTSAALRYFHHLQFVVLWIWHWKAWFPHLLIF